MNNDKQQSAKMLRKKKKSESVLSESVMVDPETLRNLAAMYIVPLSKPSTKFPKAKYVCKICPYHIDDIDRAMKHSCDVMHSKNCKRITTKNLMKYIPKPSSDQLDVIQECIDKKLKEKIFITDTEATRRHSQCQKLAEIVEDLSPGCKLQICGSLLTGLSMKKLSNVNLHLDVSNKLTKGINGGSGYLAELQKLNDAVKQKMDMTTEIRFDKNLSGLFCKDKSGISYHISANNQTQLMTSQLIGLYLQIDSRAKSLAKLFRYFASKAFIDQTSDGFFPIGIFSLLVIFYLQQLKIPILPNLHKLAELHINDPSLQESSITSYVVRDKTFKFVNNVPDARRLWNCPDNDASLAELWVGILRFYAVDFKISLYIVSITSSEPVLKVQRNIVNKRLAVEDPFDYKRNLLFSWNNNDVVDYFNDQLQACYTYFAIPQCQGGPVYKKVLFSEVSLETLNKTCNVTIIFKKNDLSDAMSIIEAEFKKLYTEEKSFYNVTKWPVSAFVEACLQRILVVIFNDKRDITNFVWLLELKVKTSAFFIINSYVVFNDHAVEMAKVVLEYFGEYFDSKQLWNQSEMNSRDAFDIIRNSVQIFIKRSLDISDIHEDCEEDDYVDDGNESESEMPTEEEVPLPLEDIADENANVVGSTTVVDNDISQQKRLPEMMIIDGETPETAEGNEPSTVPMSAITVDREYWKLPIAFKGIYVSVKGILDSSTELDSFNEQLVNAVRKEDLVYDFGNMEIHRHRMEVTCGICNGKGHRREDCRNAIPRFDELQGVLALVNERWLERLTNLLLLKYQNILPDEARRKMNEEMFSSIDRVIKDVYGNARPQLFGSANNGFMNRASDLDICLEFYEGGGGGEEVEGHNTEDHGRRLVLQTKEITSRLVCIGRELRKRMPTMELVYILRAKVPIIKFYLRDVVQGDISINNSLALQNTRMVKLYADLSKCTRPLGNLIKYVSKCCDIGDASQGTLSSYAYVLMLIYFLQRRGVLPVLQQLFDGDQRPSVIIDGWDAWYQSDMTQIYGLWKSALSQQPCLGYLWLDFFYFYSVEFPFDRQVVSIRQTDPLYKMDKGWDKSYLAIEDPFDLSHNLGGSLSLDKSRYILQCFAHILRLHSNSDNLLRPENGHYILLEPATLRPPTNLNSNRTCFQCNKVGHVARDCTEKRTPMKNKLIQQPNGLPLLSKPLQYRHTVIPTNFYLQPDAAATEEGSRFLSVPLNSFGNSTVNDFAVMPMCLSYGEQTIVIPVCVAKDDRIAKRLDDVFKNIQKEEMCSFPTNQLPSNMIHAYELPGGNNGGVIRRQKGNNGVMSEINSQFHQQQLPPRAGMRNPYPHATPPPPTQQQLPHHHQPIRSTLVNSNSHHHQQQQLQMMGRMQQQHIGGPPGFMDDVQLRQHSFSQQQMMINHLPPRQSVPLHHQQQPRQLHQHPNMSMVNHSIARPSKTNNRR